MILKKKDGTIKEEKKNWYADRYQAVVQQRNILAVVTLISLISSVIAAFSISQLAPLKSVEPFVIQIDQKSGITQVVNPITATEFSGNEAVNEYFLVQFLRARESWGIANEEYFNAVRVMSEPDTVFRSYVQDVDPVNPGGFRSKMQEGSIRSVRVGLVTKTGERDDPTDGAKIRRYQVRLIISEKGRSNSSSKNKVATLEFKYMKLNLSVQDRYLNPIGFRVVSYRIDEDALAP